MLGPVQDSVGGGLVYKQSFQGTLTSVNLFSYVRGARQVQSRVRRSLACQWKGRCTSCPTLLIESKKATVVIPSTFYRIRSVLGDDYSSTSDAYVLC